MSSPYTIGSRSASGKKSKSHSMHLNKSVLSESDIVIM